MKCGKGGAGLGEEYFFEPIPQERQTKVITRYIWDMKPEDWPKGVTAQQVEEMHERHNRRLHEASEKKKREGKR